jgi:hypothetical protein
MGGIKNGGGRVAFETPLGRLIITIKACGPARHEVARSTRKPSKYEREKKSALQDEAQQKGSIAKP